MVCGRCHLFPFSSPSLFTYRSIRLEGHVPPLTAFQFPPTRSPLHVYSFAKDGLIIGWGLLPRRFVLPLSFFPILRLEVGYFVDEVCGLLVSKWSARMPSYQK